jgi:hypothetical protein
MLTPTTSTTTTPVPAGTLKATVANVATFDVEAFKNGLAQVLGCNASAIVIIGNVTSTGEISFTFTGPRSATLYDKTLNLTPEQQAALGVTGMAPTDSGGVDVATPKTWIIYAAVGATVALVVIAAVGFAWKKRSQREHPRRDDDHVNMADFQPNKALV